MGVEAGGAGGESAPPRAMIRLRNSEILKNDNFDYCVSFCTRFINVVVCGPDLGRPGAGR